MGLVIGSATPEGLAEALGERRLAGAELTGQQDQVAGSGQLGQRGGQRLGLVDRSTAGQQHQAFLSLVGVDGRAAGGHEGPLGPHEVGPHLGQRLAAAPQGVGRVQRRDEHRAAGTGSRGRAAW